MMISVLNCADFGEDRGGGPEPLENPRMDPPPPYRKHERPEDSDTLSEVSEKRVQTELRGMNEDLSESPPENGEFPLENV